MVISARLALATNYNTPYRVLGLPEPVRPTLYGGMQRFLPYNPTNSGIKYAL